VSLVIIVVKASILAEPFSSIKQVEFYSKLLDFTSFILVIVIILCS